MRKIIGLIGVLILILASTVVFAENNISSTVVVNGEHITITGQFANISKSIPITLRVGSIENILYVWQTMTTEEGSFSFDFEMPDNTPSGEYEYRVASDSVATGYTGTIIYNYTQPQYQNIESVVSTNGQAVNIAGTVLNANQCVPVTLVVGDADNIFYLWQTYTEADGSFSFNFEMPDEAPSGIYRYQIRALNEKELYVSSFNYITESRIVCKAKVDGYEVNISGTVVNATSSNNVSLTFGDSDSPIYAAETVCGEDGKFTFDFTMPTEVQDGGYSFAINTDADIDEYTGTLFYVAPPAPYIECSTVVTGQNICISGQILNIESSSQVTLAVSKEGNTVYTQQALSDEDGKFSFSFNMPDTATWGDYTFTIDTDSEADIYTGSFLYEVFVERQFTNGNINISVKNYVPTMSGTISCIKGKSLMFRTINKSDSKVIVEDTIKSSDENYSLSYTLPSLITGKDYTVTISCIDGEKTLFAINAEINSSIILVSVSGDVQIDDNVRLDVRAKTANSDLIDKSASFTSSKSLSVTIPNLVANMSCDISLQGYERVKMMDEHSNSTIADAQTIKGDFANNLYISNSGESAWCMFVPQYSSFYSVNVTDGFNTKLYEKKNGCLIELDISDGIFMSYPNTYYVEIFSNSNVVGNFSLELVGTPDFKLLGKAFEKASSGDTYFSNINDSGKLYKNQNVLENTIDLFPVIWLCNFNDSLYFNAGGSLMKLTDNSYTIAGNKIDARYVTADEDFIYFSNWSDSGKIYRGIPTDDNMIFEKVCDDCGSWIVVDGEYLYYKNALDRNKEYRILKTSVNAENGELVD